MKIATTQRVLGALAISVVLAACGGGDGAGSVADSSTGNGSTGNGSTGGSGGGGGSGGNGGGSGGGTVTPTAVTYMGVISFGDTIAVTLDAPASGKLKIRFADSTFGLAGTLVGDYAKAGAIYTVSNLVEDGADPPPAFVSAVLGSITATFSVSGTTLTGEIAGLPRQLGGGKLSGHVTASIASTAPAVASLAGMYSFMRTQSTYVTSSGNLQAQYGMVGQTLVDANGSVRMCQFSTYSDTCGGMLTGTLSLADQTRYPGAYDLTMAGKRWGRVFPLLADGVQTLYFDHNQRDGVGNQITGAGVFRPVQTLTAGQVAGTWTCSQPGVASAQVSGIGMPIALDGTIQTETLTISADGMILGSKSGLPALLASNVAGNLLGSAPMPTAMPGAMSTNWLVEPPLPAGVRAQVFMPVGANTMAYFAEVKGVAETLVDGVPTPRAWTYVAPGTCTRG